MMVVIEFRLANKERHFFIKATVVRVGHET